MRANTPSLACRQKDRAKKPLKQISCFCRTAVVTVRHQRPGKAISHLHYSVRVHAQQCARCRGRQRLLAMLQNLKHHQTLHHNCLDRRKIRLLQFGRHLLVTKWCALLICSGSFHQNAEFEDWLGGFLICGAGRRENSHGRTANQAAQGCKRSEGYRLSKTL